MGFKIATDLNQLAWFVMITMYKLGYTWEWQNTFCFTWEQLQSDVKIHYCNVILRNRYTDIHI